MSHDIDYKPATCDMTPIRSMEDLGQFLSDCCRLMASRRLKASEGQTIAQLAGQLRRVLADMNAATGNAEDMSLEELKEKFDELAERSAERRTRNSNSGLHAS